MTQRKRDGHPGKVAAYMVRDVKTTTLMPHVKAKVLPGSIVYTDDWKGYGALGRLGLGYQHHRIYHSLKVYVRGNVHTSTIDGFWALVKNGIGGVYHGVSTKHLQAYLDEYSFRYNNRKDPRGVFNVWLSRVQKTREQVAASE